MSKLPGSSSLARKRGGGGARRTQPRRSVPRDAARILAASIAALCAVGAAVVAFSGTPQIAAVDVAGARHLTPAATIGASGLLGRPIFQASAADSRAALLRLPAVRDARVELALPAGARVSLTEREAAARWVVGATEWFVDAEGVLFGSSDPTAAPSLRIRDDRAPSRAAGEHLDTALVAAALRLAKVAPGELRSDATAPAVRIESGPNGIVLASGSGWEIRFGTPDRIEEKLQAALTVLRGSADRRLEYVDVRTLPQVVVSPPR